MMDGKYVVVFFGLKNEQKNLQQGSVESLLDESESILKSDYYRSKFGSVTSITHL